MMKYEKLFCDRFPRGILVSESNGGPELCSPRNANIVRNQGFEKQPTPADDIKMTKSGSRGAIKAKLRNAPITSGTLSSAAR